MANARDFRKTVKSVSRNFEKYTQAMESDVQLLITGMLESIEMKIMALQRLLKLKLCIRNVRSVAGLECLTRMDDLSLNTVISVGEKREDIKKDCGSLEDLSSMVYEVEKNSLPKEEDDVGAAVESPKKVIFLEGIADIENLCSALNHHNSKMGNVHNENSEEDPREALNKYIYMLLDAERQKMKNPAPEDTDYKPHTIGDFAEQMHSEAGKVKPKKSQDSVIYLGKSDYQSILDILNMVLRSYKMQEEISKRNKVIEKTKTEPVISSAMNETDHRKIVSDSLCQQKENNQTEKKHKNKKYTCV